MALDINVRYGTKTIDQLDPYDKDEDGLLQPSDVLPVFVQNSQKTKKINLQTLQNTIDTKTVYPIATQDKDGLLSKQDKEKLDNISDIITDNTVRNLKDGSATGSLRTVGSEKETQEYKLGMYSFAEGKDTMTPRDFSHAEGDGSHANGIASHAEGKQTVASGYASHTEGSSTVASGNVSHAEGESTVASGGNSHTEGDNTKAQGSNSHAEGSQTTASSFASHAEGNFSTASGLASHAEGYGTTSIGQGCHAEGQNTRASGIGAHAEGFNTATEGTYSHAEGYQTFAAGQSSHAEGRGTIARGTNSHASGLNTVAQYDNQFIIGKNNYFQNSSNYPFIIGNGRNNNDRSNALTVDWNGNIETSGTPTKANHLARMRDIANVSNEIGYDILTGKTLAEDWDFGTLQIRLNKNEEKYFLQISSMYQISNPTITLHILAYQCVLDIDGDFSTADYAGQWLPLELHSESYPNTYNQILSILAGETISSSPISIRIKFVNSFNEEFISFTKDTYNNKTLYLLDKIPYEIQESIFNSSLYGFKQGYQKRKIDANTSFLDLIYPVGSIYMSMSATHPSQLFGGNWQALAPGRMLLGAGENDGVTYSLNQTGGNKDMIIPYHTHTVASSGSGTTGSAGSHTHVFASSAKSMTFGKTESNKSGLGQVRVTAASSGNYRVPYSNSTKVDFYGGVALNSAGAHTHSTPNHTHTINYAGTNENTINANMPPYLVVNIWQRLED